MKYAYQRNRFWDDFSFKLLLNTRNHFNIDLLPVVEFILWKSFSRPFNLVLRPNKQIYYDVVEDDDEAASETGVGNAVNDPVAIAVSVDFVEDD